jgi:iron complex outermembrane receptor protein
VNRLAAITILAFFSLVVPPVPGVIAAPDPPDSTAAGPILELPGLTVIGQRVGGNIIEVDIEDLPHAGPGPGAALRLVPGAGVNANGPLTSITQYRGLYGNRLNVLVDGVITNSACPNEMEPPLHYVSLPRFRSLEVVRGIAPVSSGLETMGTTVRATTGRLNWGDDATFRFTGDVSAFAHTADDGYSYGGLVGVSNEHHRIQAGATRDHGENLRFGGGGKVAASAYSRSAWEVGYGFRGGGHELDLAYLRNETGETGTPALPMDIRYVDADIYRLAYDLASGLGELGVRASYAWTDHIMDNYTLRPPPSPMMRRYSPTTSSSTSYGVDLKRPLGGGHVMLGADGNLAGNNADIYSPDNPSFFVNNFHGVRRDRYGFFGEWQGAISGRWSGELGLRYNRVISNAAEVDASAARNPGGVQTLRDRFNAEDRNQADDNLDVVIQAGYRLVAGADLQLGAARKMRSPSYQERYLWLPLESTSGLADGNRYVGDISLRPEASHQVELALDLGARMYRVSPRFFYRRVDDYIQGTPATDPVVIAVSTAMGDPEPLQFSNVEAELYGLDVPFAVRLGAAWSLDGVLGWVRGKRLDIDDNLYRIAPLNGSLALRYGGESWAVTLETVMAAEQDKVSVTNHENPSPGWVLLNLHGHYRLAGFRDRDVLVRAGVTNLLDQEYRPHLHGINRVKESDVAVGTRLPGAGLTAYVGATVPW